MEKKRQQRGVIRSILFFVITAIVLFSLCEKDRNIDGLSVNLAIVDLVARFTMACILLSYSHVLLKIGAFLFAYAKIFGIAGFACSVQGFFKIEMTLEIVGIALIVICLIPLSKNILGDQLFKLAFSDSLTGLMNRHAFLNQARKFLKISAERGRTAAVIYVDLNRFKSVNDYHGHHTGDEVLGTVGRRIKTMVRKGDLVARIGGDEFVFFLSDADEKIAEDVAKRIVDRISCPIMANGVQFCLGASAGIAIFPKNGETIEELIEKADSAMYKAKAMESGYMFASKAESI